MSDTDEFESLADWMGEQDWTVNVRDYTDEYVTYVREQPVELLAERLMQSSWLAEHDAALSEALADEIRHKQHAESIRQMLREKARQRREEKP